MWKLNEGLYVLSFSLYFQILLSTPWVFGEGGSRKRFLLFLNTNSFIIMVHRKIYLRWSVNWQGT